MELTSNYARAWTYISSVYLLILYYAAKLNTIFNSFFFLKLTHFSFNRHPQLWKERRRNFQVRYKLNLGINTSKLHEPWSPLLWSALNQHWHGKGLDQWGLTLSWGLLSYRSVSNLETSYNRTCVLQNLCVHVKKQLSQWGTSKLKPVPTEAWSYGIFWWQPSSLTPTL